MELLWLLIILALFDAINPVNVSSLFLVLLKNKYRSFGMILGLFLSFFLAGAGILALIKLFSPLLISIVCLITVLILILMGVIDILNFHKGISFAFPKKYETVCKPYFEDDSIFTAIISGFLIASIQLPLTAGPYLGVILLININYGVSQLLLYNLAFITPLLLIVLLNLFGVRLVKIRDFQKDKRKYVRFLMGCILIILAVFIIKAYLISP